LLISLIDHGLVPLVCGRTTVPRAWK
jgi:hypothetical protein